MMRGFESISVFGASGTAPAESETLQGKQESFEWNQNRFESACTEDLEKILSTLRHELANPINSLKITLDVLRKNYDLFDQDKKMEYLNRCWELLMRQERLVEAMKSYSRFSVKDQERLPFQSFWERLVGCASERAKKGGVELTFKEDAGPLSVRGNGSALQKVMSNILDNALDALKGTEEPVIELTARQVLNGVSVSIKDNGQGIGEEEMSRIFIPLFTTRPEKTGMGLPIARKLLSMMDAQMHIKSLSGEGTEVCVFLRSECP